MTTYLITEAQRETLLDTYKYDGIDKWQGNVDMLQSLPMVSAEPVAHMYPWDLERFATNETTGHAYSVAVGCPDGKSVPLYTSPQALTQITELEAQLRAVVQELRIKAGNITELESQLADAKQVANDCRIVADNAIAEAFGAKKDAERGRYMIKHGGWIRHDDYTSLEVIVAKDAELSCVAMRENAIDAAIAEGKA